MGGKIFEQEALAQLELAALAEQQQLAAQKQLIESERIADETAEREAAEREAATSPPKSAKGKRPPSNAGRKTSASKAPPEPKLGLLSRPF